MFFFLNHSLVYTGSLNLSELVSFPRAMFALLRTLLRMPLGEIKYSSAQTEVHLKQDLTSGLLRHCTGILEGGHSTDSEMSFSYLTFGNLYRVKLLITHLIGSWQIFSPIV